MLCTLTRNIYLADFFLELDSRIVPFEQRPPPPSSSCRGPLTPVCCAYSPVHPPPHSDTHLQRRRILESGKYTWAHGQILIICMCNVRLSTHRGSLH